VRALELRERGGEVGSRSAPWDPAHIGDCQRYCGRLDGSTAVLFAAAVYGAKRIRLRPELVSALAVVAAIVGNFLLGPIPLWRFVPGGETLQAKAVQVSGHDRIASEALARIPSGAAVTATNSLGAHLSERKRIFSFP